MTTSTIPEELFTAASRSGFDDRELEAFAKHLHSMPANQAARINPFAFAAAAGTDADKTVDLFVHGAQLGLFDLEWGMVCPMCGAITNSVSDLGRVEEDVLFCSLCRRDADSVLDDTIEVTFAHVPAVSTLDLHGDFASYQHYFTSSSYPHREKWLAYHQRNTVADARLDPGQQRTVQLDLQAGRNYRLLCLDTHSGASLQVPEDASSSTEQQVALTLSENGFSQTDVTLTGTRVSLQLTNDTEQPVWVRAMLIDFDQIMAIVDGGPPQFGQRLTGKYLINNQAFRDNFAMDELAADLKLKLRSLTLLFTDLKGSTELYDREGDLAAYRLVQDHFAALKQVVRSHKGAVVKTMGDAVMAAFPNVKDGTAAAISMMAAMQELSGGQPEKKVGLKVGLHAGPALAINAGQNLDYFGQTVNIAARVQGLADAGEICLTGALNADSEVPMLLNRAGYKGAAEVARLKGVSAQEQIHRYRGAA